MVSATSARKWSGERVGVLAVAFSWLAMSVFASAPVSAQRGTTITLNPTGGDDTANLQGAFDACRGGDHPCTIRLGAGTFHIAQVIAWDFHGALQGMGRDRTIIRALPLLHVNDAAPTPWFADPTPEEPWPVLVTFLDGDFVVSDMSVRIPDYPVTEPWDYYGVTLHEILVFFVAGGRTYHADATFDRVDVEGGPGPFYGYNLIWAFAYEGDTAYRTFDPSPRPLSGSFTVVHSSVHWATTAVLAVHTGDARIVARENAVDTVDMGFSAASVLAGTEVEFTHNSARNIRDAAAIVQAYDEVPGAGAGHILIAHNQFHVVGGSLFFDLGFGYEGEAVEMWDLTARNSVRVEILDNEFLIENATSNGVLSVGVRDLVMSGNHVQGVGSAGVFLFQSSGLLSGNHVRAMDTGLLIAGRGPSPARVEANHLDGNGVGVMLQGATSVSVWENHVKASKLWGIAVVSDASGNVVGRNYVKDSGEFDLMWDGTGTANVWSKNHCGTSDPPGLC